MKRVWEKSQSLCEQSQRAYVEENDDVGDFVKTHCEMGTSKDFVVNTTELREHFQSLKEMAIDAKLFKQKMMHRGFTAKPTRIHGVMRQAFHGIKIKQ